MSSLRGTVRFCWLRPRGKAPVPRQPAAGLLLRVLALASILAIPVALTGANVVGTSQAGQHGATAGADDVKPTDCASLTIAALYKGTGAVTGGTTNDLVLGGPADQILDGGEGNDCILGGGGNDQIDGGPGSDVCIGGPGEDTFSSCETIIQGDPSF